MPLHVILGRGPTLVVVAVVTEATAASLREGLSVVVEMTRCTSIGDGEGVGELASRRFDRNPQQRLMSVALDVAGGAFDVRVLAGEREFRVGMVEAVFNGGALDPVPAPSRMATRTATPEAALVLVPMTRLATGKVKWSELYGQLAASAARRSVAFRAFCSDVLACEPVARLIVVESLRFLPRVLRVAVLAASPCELVGVRVVTIVTVRAGRAEAQHGMIERSVLAFVQANVRCRDVVDLVTLPAGSFGVSCHQLEASLCVVEADRVKLYERNFAASVFRVAAATGLRSHGRVVAASLVHAVAQRLVTFQALAVGRTWPTEFVTALALEKALELSVRR